jgi:hypothetical protein
VFPNFAAALTARAGRGGVHYICRRGPRVCAEWEATTQVETVSRIVWASCGESAAARGVGHLPPGIHDAACDQST